MEHWRHLSVADIGLTSSYILWCPKPWSSKNSLPLEPFWPMIGLWDVTRLSPCGILKGPKRFAPSLDYFSKGVEEPILYKVPQIIVYSLALLFSWVTSDGSHRRLPSSIYFFIRVIKDGEVVQPMDDSIFLETSRLGVFLVSWHYLPWDFNARDNTSAWVFSFCGTWVISNSLNLSSFLISNLRYHFTNMSLA